MIAHGSLPGRQNPVLGGRAVRCVTAKIQKSRKNVILYGLAHPDHTSGSVIGW
jgi:hypothetical protein